MERTEANLREAPALLERSLELAALNDALAAVRGRGGGRLVLVGGEAGVGKTSLLRAFHAEHAGSARFLWGGCDALFTPRPLGPFLEIAQDAGSQLEQLVATGAHPHEVAAALLEAIDDGAPAVVVLDDVHWADTATLDVLRLLARRLESVPALVVATYRDDEPGDRLREVIGDVTTRPAVRRMSLSPLSADAVRELSAPNGIDGDELHRTTGGNPFFVSEVLAAGGGAIPRTVRDAVLARAARLDEPARRLLGAVSIEPGQAEIGLLERIAPDTIEHLGECIDAGMLKPAPTAVAFRHELARRTIEEALSPERRVALHRAALEVIGPASDPARLAHHAEASADADAVLRFAPPAAERAAALGAHREAAAHWARAVRFADGLDPDARAELLERRAHECLISGQEREAADALELAIALRREGGDPLRVGDDLRALSRPLSVIGRREEAQRVLGEAIAMLEPLPAGRELAMAYSAAAASCMMADDLPGTRHWGDRALELAERLDDLETMAHALNNIGSAELGAGNQQGRELLERSLEISRRLGSDDHVARALNNLAGNLLRLRSYALAERYVDEGLAFAEERGNELKHDVLLVNRAELRLRQGRLSAALADAEAVTAAHSGEELVRLMARVLLAVAGVRRGEAGARAALEELRPSAVRLAEADPLVLVALGLAEAAWLEGDGDTVGAVTQDALARAERSGLFWEIGELACWRRRAGITEEPPAGIADPCALELAGDNERAAERWTEIGCPFEAAMALAGADDETAQRRALDMLQELGATPAAAVVARRLRERGVRGLPRGPRPSTRSNPSNLTSREVEVLRLLAEGLPNAGIADRLVLSPRTVDHHVSAILRKLDVRTRGQASAEAVRRGLVALD